MSLDNKTYDVCRLIAERAGAVGGRAYFVGGYVRDLIRGVENKDVDIEVHGLYPKQLEDVLDSIGERMSFGESFGVYGLKGFELDIAMPRKEKLTGRGHRDFDVFVDPFIGTYKAAMRRDFTVNSLMQDILSGEIVDNFGGAEDIKRRVIRHVYDESFAEDPLRVLRGAQFAARFEYSVAPETIELCARMELGTLAKERVESELKKALLKAERPSVFFKVLREMGQLEVWFPECGALIGVGQDPRFHAEGDVWTHTMMVLDAAAKYRDRVDDPFSFMLAALLHDVGKATATENIDGVIHAYGHEKLGLPEAVRLLRRICSENRVTEYVLPLVEQHMKPNILAQNKAKIKATNKLFDSVPDPKALICLALADKQGQILQTPEESTEGFLRERLEVYREYMSRPYVMGKDLIAAGLEPSERFSELLAYAHKLRLAGIDKQSALKHTLAMARKDPDSK